MSIEMIVSCRTALDWHYGGKEPADSKTGYWCRGCGVELAVTPFGQARIKEGGVPYCNRCGLTIANKRVKEETGAEHIVVIGPEAAKQLDRMGRRGDFHEK